MQLTIKNDEHFDNLVKQIIREELNKQGLMRFIKDEIRQQFFMWQKGHKNIEERFDNVVGRCCKIEAKIRQKNELVSKGEIREMITEVFNSWQKDHSSVLCRIASIEQKIAQVKLKEQQPL